MSKKTTIRIQLKPKTHRSSVPQASGQEWEILWGRIFGVCALLAGLVVAVAWGMHRFGSAPVTQDAELMQTVTPVEAPVSLDKRVVEAGVNPVQAATEKASGAPALAEDAAKAQTQVSSVDQPVAEVHKTQPPERAELNEDTPSTAVVSTPTGESKDVKSQKVKPQAATVSAELKDPIENPSQSAQLPPTLAQLSEVPEAVKSVRVTQPSNGVAEVAILSPKIHSAAVSDERVQREPGRALPKMLHMGASDLLTVYFFTDYRNLQGLWVYHDWYLNGKRVARVKSRPHKQTFNAYSSKYIDRHMTGDWQVKVVDENNQLLAQTRFEVLP